MSASRADAANARRDDPDRAEWIAAALDQQYIGANEGGWTVHVLGVHTDRDEIWIQVASDPEGSDAFVLHLSPWATPQHALAALAATRLDNGSYPQVVPVMRSA